MKYYVYQLKDPTTNIPFYIGKGCGKRYMHHLWESYAKKDSNNFKQFKIQKLRANGIEPVAEILEFFETEYEALQKEKSLIDYYGMRINSKKGVLTNLKPDNNAASVKPRKPMSDETKAKISQALKGKKLSDEHKQKLSEARNRSTYKRVVSEQTRSKMSTSLKGRVVTEETRQKIAKTIINNCGKLWEVVSPNGELYRIKNLTNFCRENNLNAETLRSVAKDIMNGKSKRNHKGWTCRQISS